MHGRWVNVAARVYYVFGALYYLYHWLIIFGAGGLLVALFSHSASRNQIAFYALSPSLTALIWGLVIWSKRKTVEIQSQNPALYEMELHSTYILHGGGRYHYDRSLKVKARYDGVDHYTAKFTWSGGHGVQPNVHAQGPHTVTVMRAERDYQSVARINFQRPLRKGEVLDFMYSLELNDPQGQAKPFLAHTVYHRTDKVWLTIRFDTPPAIRFFTRQIFLSTSADIPMFEEVVNVPPNATTLEWQIARPRIGYRYKIIW